MRRTNPCVVSCVALLSILCQSTAAQRPLPRAHEFGANVVLHSIHSLPTGGQLGADLQSIANPDVDGRFFLGQTSRDGRWILTPNEAFFPKLGLRATGKGSVPDTDGLNKGESFNSISDWNAGETAQWGVFASRAGDVTWKVWMAAEDDRSRFQLRFGESVSSFSLPNTRGVPKQVASGKLSFTQRGMQTIEVECQRGGRNAQLMAIELEGPPIQEGAVLRKRWRPAAAHTRFRSSQSPQSIRLWVMEMDAVPGDLPFYCPVTTPFGYYGPTWQADGTVNASFNFSLWSFGRGKKSPPIEQLSHLLAVGNRDATFGGFNHEGTGVKVRNWEPLTGRQGPRQTLALRVEPGKTYDTYYSYFYATDEHRWRLFGVGNKFNNGKPLDSLWVGSFVEVPGRAAVQRSGPYPRVMRYRGWVMDKAGNWYTLDRMKRGNVDRESQLTHTDRGVTADGWFYLQTGGWEFRKVQTTDDVIATNLTQPSNVPFLGQQDIQALTSIPSSIDTPVLKRQGNHVTAQLRVTNPGDRSKVTVYWGDQEALTFEDRWQHSAVAATTIDGISKIQISDWPKDRPLSVRARLDNEHGKFWSPETARVP